MALGAFWEEILPQNADKAVQTVILSRTAAPVREKFVYRRTIEPLSTDGRGRYNHFQREIANIGLGPRWHEPSRPGEKERP